MRSYDFIIVGAGSAGCVLANRLSDHDDARVLLLEAGPARKLPDMLRPQAWQDLRTTSANWGDHTVTQAASGTAIPLPRGRGLGGSSAINVMLFARGHRSSYDAWVTAGAKGWGFDDLLPFMMRSETAPRRDSALRGQDGRLVVSAPTQLNPFFTASWDAATECGHRRAQDASGGVEEGFGPPDQNIVAGQRQNSADAYLTAAAGRSNLDVVTEATVHQLHLAGDRCTGVSYRGGSGEKVSVDCRGEVVLAAGAIGTPKLLMLSGIGPAAHLRDIGISVSLDLPGVGSNLHDHPICPVVYRPAQPMPPALSNHSEVIGLLRSQFATDGPDLQIIFLDLPASPPGYPAIPEGYTIRPSLMTPYSRGTVRLPSADPDAPPLIDPNYYSDPRDVRTVVEGVRRAREIGQAEALTPWRAVELLPGPDQRDEASLERYVRASLGSYSHPVGTCRMGDDEDAVVDTALRVPGISGLRVADASIMPSVVSSNTNATVYAIAERAACLLAS
jgi:choline dehydrogenase-like flavoprotein